VYNVNPLPLTLTQGVAGNYPPCLYIAFAPPVIFISQAGFVGPGRILGSPSNYRHVAGPRRIVTSK